jgi:protein-disulfide isomerase
LKKIASVCAVAVLLGCVAAGQSTPSKTSNAKPSTAPAKPPVSATTTANPNAPSQATVDSFIKHYFGYNPSFTWKVDAIQPSEVPGMSEVMMTYTSGDQAQRMRFYVTADGSHAIFGDAVPFGADPFRTEREVLEKKADGAFEGPAKAAVEIVEFSDLQCPHCKVAFPTLQRLIGDEPQAKLVFQSFPLPMHDWAQKGAQYADCVGQKSNDGFWKFAGGVFEAQDSITAATADAKFAEIAGSSGVDGKAVAACAVLPATAERVKRSFELGRELNVSGTPTVFVNGRRISSVNALSYEELKAIVDFEVQMAQAPAK